MCRLRWLRFAGKAGSAWEIRAGVLCPELFYGLFYDAKVKRSFGQSQFRHNLFIAHFFLFPLPSQTSSLFLIFVLRHMGIHIHGRAVKVISHNPLHHIGLHLCRKTATAICIYETMSLFSEPHGYPLLRI